MRSRPRSRPRRASKRRVYGATSVITGTYKDGMLNIGTFPVGMMYMQPRVEGDKLTLKTDRTGGNATEKNLLENREKYGLRTTKLRTTEDVVFIGSENSQEQYAVKLIELGHDDKMQQKKLLANYEVLCTEYASLEGFGAEFVCSMGLKGYIALVTEYLPTSLSKAQLTIEIGQKMTDTFDHMLKRGYYNLDMNLGNMFIDKNGVPRVIDQGRVSQNSDHYDQFLYEIEMLAHALGGKITETLLQFAKSKRDPRSASSSAVSSGTPGSKGRFHALKSITSSGAGGIPRSQGKSSTSSSAASGSSLRRFIARISPGAGGNSRRRGKSSTSSSTPEVGVASIIQNINTPFIIEESYFAESQLTPWSTSPRPSVSSRETPLSSPPSQASSPHSPTRRLDFKF